MTNYRASDGTIFTDPNAFQNYENSNKYSFKNRDGEMLNKISGEIDFHAFLCTHLLDCEIILADGIGPMEIHDVHKCKIFIGACKSKMKISKMSGCKIVAAAIELEIEDCSDCHFSIYTATSPQIHFGTCQNLTFGPFMGGYDDQKDHLLAAGLDISHTNNQWYKVISPDAFIIPMNSSIQSHVDIINFVKESNIRLLEQDEVERIQEIYESEEYDEDDQELMRTMPWMPLGEADNVIPFTFPESESSELENFNLANASDNITNSHNNNNNNNKDDDDGESLRMEIQMTTDLQTTLNDNDTNNNFDENLNHKDITTSDIFQRNEGIEDETIMNHTTATMPISQEDESKTYALNILHHDQQQQQQQQDPSQDSSKFDQMLWEKREEEEKHLHQCKIKAKEDLHKFYNEKQLSKEKRQQINRDLEKLKWEKEEEIFTVTNSYERILSLIDIQEDKRAIHNASHYIQNDAYITSRSGDTSDSNMKKKKKTTTQELKRKVDFGNTLGVSGGGIGLQDISRFRSVLISCKESYNENDI